MIPAIFQQHNPNPNRIQKVKTQNSWIKSGNLLSKTSNTKENMSVFSGSDPFNV